MRALAGAGHVVADRYRLRDQIGRGAMGAVWQARDELLDRDVAVKELVISPSLGTSDRGSLYERTLREARTAARLSHPGVVTVFDVVEEDGRPWIVMELVRARSLERVLAEDGPLPPAQAAGIGQQLISALTAAHEAGVLHRDVKPSNVLLCPDGRAVLTDFGIATLEGDSQLTQAGMVMGTPAFTAPERIRGWPAAPASDFWSLGATLYAAVQGRGPFTERGGPMTTMNAVIHEETPAAPAAGPLGPVIAALMDRDPAARPDAAAAARMLAEARAATADARRLQDTPRPDSWAAGQPPAADAAWAVPLPRAAGAFPKAGAPWPVSEASAAAPGSADQAPASSWPTDQSAASSWPTDQSAASSWPTDQPPAAASWPTDQIPATDSWPADQAPAAEAAWPMSAPTMADSAQAGYPPPAGMPYSAPVTQTGGAAPPVAGPPAPSADGARRAGQPGHTGQPGRAGARIGRRRRRTMLVVCVAATVVAAGVLGGFALAQFTGSRAKSGTAGTDTGHGKPSRGRATSPAPAGAPAQTALPAGYIWYTLPAAEAGTDAGFRTAVPAGWNTARNGLVTYIRNPSGSGFIEVDLTRHAKAGNLAQARWLQLKSIRQDRFPGYRRISLRPATVLGSPGAVWTFSWTERGTGRVIAQDYLFTATARGGSTQYYAVYGSAPTADWPQTARALREVIGTFQPLS